MSQLVPVTRSAAAADDAAAPTATVTSRSVGSVAKIVHTLTAAKVWTPPVVGKSVQLEPRAVPVPVRRGKKKIDGLPAATKVTVDTGVQTDTMSDHQIMTELLHLNQAQANLLWTVLRQYLGSHPAAAAAAASGQSGQLAGGSTAGGSTVSVSSVATNGSSPSTAGGNSAASEVEGVASSAVGGELEVEGVANHCAGGSSAASETGGVANPAVVCSAVSPLDLSTKN